MITAGLLAPLDGVRHAFFTREGGVSTGLYDSRNCGYGSQDEPARVARNRALCAADLGVAEAGLVTVYQTHSPDVVVAADPWPAERAPRADAIVTDRPGLALAILTADCAPVLFADPAAGVIGAAHAGWRGALGGVLENTVAAMTRLGAMAGRIRAAIGPRIAQASYEVGPEFREAFVAGDADLAALFETGGRPNHFHFDLAGYVVGRLDRIGIAAHEAVSHDTAAEEDRFFSYRRAQLRGETDYGRCLSAIAIAG